MKELRLDYEIISQLGRVVWLDFTY